MRKLVSIIIIALVLVLASSQIAYADVVFGNDFESERSGDLTRLSRSVFVANGPNGSVSVRLEPGSRTEIDRFKNGRQLFMSSTYIGLVTDVNVYSDTFETVIPNNLNLLMEW